MAQSFEASVKELETIVKNLEAGKLPLDQSIEEFEKGIRLARECQSMLDKAEQKVKNLLSGEQK